MVYVVNLENDPEAGQIVAQIIDAPGALTVGKDREDALHWIEDALITLFSDYIDLGKPIPKPSRPPQPGEPSITLPALVMAKLAVYEAMQEKGITQTELASRLGVDPRQVRRILNLYHKSRIDQIEAALKVLGKRLKVEVQEAA